MERIFVSEMDFEADDRADLISRSGYCNVLLETHRSWICFKANISSLKGLLVNKMIN